MSFAEEASHCRWLLRHLGIGRAHVVGHSSSAMIALRSPSIGRLAAEPGTRTVLTPPVDVPAIFAAARSGDALAREVASETARRIALHVVPIAAVTDVALVVLGGGLGANGDLLLDPVRSHLDAWLPYPPRVEISSLGDAAVLSGALSTGLGAALDNVFVNRARLARS